MIAIVLAAGKGTRMRPLTNTRLKGSLPILNQPLLLRITDMLNNSGLIDKIVLVIAPWQLDSMKELFSVTSYSSMIDFAIQDPPQGTGDAVAQAESFIGDAKRCLVLNGDILAPIEDILPKLLAHHKKLNAACSMTVYPGKDKRYGLLQITNDGKVVDLKEKAKAEEINDDIGYINAGIYVFEREIFDAIRKTPLSARGEYEITGAIELLGQMKPIGAVITDTWMSIENPIDLFKAQQFQFLTDHIQSIQFHSGGEIGFKAAEDVFFEEGAEINFSSITIKGPVLIGKGTLIETGSSIGPFAYIGRDCEIAANSSIQKSLIFDFCKLNENCSANNLIAGEELLIGKHVTVQPPKNEFVVLGGQTIITNEVTITVGVKIKAHTVIKKNTKIKSD